MVLFKSELSIPDTLPDWPGRTFFKQTWLSLFSGHKWFYWDFVIYFISYKNSLFFKYKRRTPCKIRNSSTNSSREKSFRYFKGFWSRIYLVQSFSWSLTTKMMVEWNGGGGLHLSARSSVFGVSCGDWCDSALTKLTFTCCVCLLKDCENYWNYKICNTDVLRRQKMSEIFMQASLTWTSLQNRP